MRDYAVPKQRQSSSRREEPRPRKYGRNRGGRLPVRRTLTNIIGSVQWLDNGVSNVNRRFYRMLISEFA